MRRWHNEVPLMTRRWRKELATHTYHPNSYWSRYGYDCMAPPSVACDVDCHCSRGCGTVRKRTLSGHSHACLMCNWEKYFDGWRKDRFNKRRKAIEFDYNLG